MVRMRPQPDSARAIDDFPVIGLIPAAGSARRLGSGVTSSKEILIVGGRPVYVHLLDAFASGGIDQTVIVVRHTKSDLLTSIESQPDRVIEPVVIDSSDSELYSVRRGVEETREATIALGYPDILFQPRTAYRDLLAQQRRDGADVVLGLFPFDSPEKVDMVALDGRGKPRDILIKQDTSELRYAWALAVWTRRFSDYLIDSWVPEPTGSESPEPSVGHVIRQALEDGVGVDCVMFDDGWLLDIGTPEDLARAKLLLPD